MFQKISLRELLFSGTHGPDGREPYELQTFRVDIDMVVHVARALKSDCLDDTYNYKKAYVIAKEIIEGQHLHLIESIADRIAKQIVLDPLVAVVKVRVSKHHALQTGFPVVEVVRKRIPSEQDKELSEILGK